MQIITRKTRRVWVNHGNEEPFPVQKWNKKRRHGMVLHEWFAWLHQTKIHKQCALKSVCVRARERERWSETSKCNTHCNQIKTFADANQFNDAENLFYWNIPNDMHGRQASRQTHTKPISAELYCHSVRTHSFVFCFGFHFFLSLMLYLRSLSVFICYSGFVYGKIKREKRWLVTITIHSFTQCVCLTGFLFEAFETSTYQCQIA